jgi:hypothetical protein
MKLYQILEAYDKNLALKVAKQIDVEPSRLKEIVVDIDGPNVPNGVWVLKQISKNNDIGVRIQRRLKAALEKFPKVQSKLTEKNLNKYDLDSLETSIAGFTVDEPTSIHPISGPGILFLQEFKESPDTTYYAYAMLDPKSLAKWSCGGDPSDDSASSWCVRKEGVAATTLRTSPQVMIFKNNSPTTLFALDRSQIKNSGNVDESRPELLRIVEHIISEYGDKIWEARAQNIPPFDKIIAKCTSDPQHCTPPHLSDEERKVLMGNVRDTVIRYMFAAFSATNELLPAWPEFEELLAADEENAELLPTYYAFNEQSKTEVPMQKLQELYAKDPADGLAYMLDYIQKVKKVTDHSKDKKLNDIQQKAITDVEAMLVKAFTGEPDKITLSLLQAASYHSSRIHRIPEFDKWILNFDPSSLNGYWQGELEAAQMTIRNGYSYEIRAICRVTQADDMINYQLTYNQHAGFDTYTVEGSFDQDMIWRHFSITRNGQRHEEQSNNRLIEKFKSDIAEIEDATQGMDEQELIHQDGPDSYYWDVTARKIRDRNMQIVQVN